MSDKNKTKEQLIQELAILKDRIRQIEESLSSEAEVADEKLASPKHILYVEDDEVDQAIFRRFANTDDFPFSYDIVSSVPEALSRLSSCKFDAIVVDYLLGSATAFDLIKKIHDIPVVIVTGTGDEHVAVEAMKMGVYDYVVKDIGGSYIRALPFVVENAIRQKLKEDELQKNIESKLLATKEHLQSILNALPDFYFLFDEDYTFLEIIAPSYKDYSLLATVGEKVSEVLTSDLAIKVEKTIQKTIDTGHIQMLRYAIDYPQGRRYYEGRTSLLSSRPGEKKKVIWLARDVTERKISEIALEDSRKLFAVFMDNLPAAAFMKDDKGRFIYTNKYMDDLLNTTELMGHTTEEFFPGDIARKGLDSDRRVLQEGPCSYEQIIPTKTGKILDAELHKFPIFQKGKNPLIAAIGIDITARKKAEKALEESEARKDAILKVIPDLMFLINREGIFLEYYSKDENLLLLPPKEFLGKNVKDIFPAEFSHAFFAAADNAFLTRDMQSYEYSLQFDEGIRYYEARIIVSGEEELLVIIRNITERKKAEDDLRELSRHLQDFMEEERKNIAREIHDEFGQVLTAIKYDLFWLKNNISKDVVKVKSKLESMTIIVNDTIKNVKRIITELRPHILDELGLVPAMEWYLDEIRSRTSLACKLNIYPRKIVPDRQRSTTIFRIFQESLTNILRHAEATQAEVYLIADECDLILKIIDNGIGFDLDAAKSKKTFGLLGMEERAKFWDGTLTVESGIRGKGTTIAVTIPISNGDDDD